MRVIKTALIAASCIGLSASAWAQDTQTTPAPAAPAAAVATPSAPATISAADLKLRTPVIGSDGEKLGVINRVSASADGKVTDVEVAIGSTAGINAKTFRVSADMITVTGGNVSVSLSSEEAQKSAASPNG